MASEPQRDHRDLVALYAERLRSREQGQRQQGHGPGLPVGARPSRADFARQSLSDSRSLPAPRQFGRRPTPRARRAPGAGVLRGTQGIRGMRSIRMQRAGAVSAIAATALLLGTQAAGAATTHQVEPGETLWRIAHEYNTTVPQLATINGIKDPSLIVAGTDLTIISGDPGSSSTATSGGALRQYSVKPGDTLGEIAKQFGVSVDSLVQQNHIANANVITVGAVLVVPTAQPGGSQPGSASPSQSGAPLHLVMPGETLGTIARSYGISVETLAQANGIDDINVVEAGSLLQIPGTTSVSESGMVKLNGMPTARQSLPLSCEATALSITTAYWGNPVSEWAFIENMPENPNPHLGFRGSMNGSFGGTRDYGVYAEPLVPLLQQFGFQGNVFYTDGDPDPLKLQIKQGNPVIVWMTNMASEQHRSYEWIDGRRFALVPQQHVVVVYGYDNDQVYVVDPGDGAYRSFNWGDFLRSWGYFDGMSLAVSPA